MSEHFPSSAFPNFPGRQKLDRCRPNIEMASDPLDTLRVVDLKARAKALGLSVSGLRKADLIEKIQEAESSGSPTSMSATSSLSDAESYKSRYSGLYEGAVDPYSDVRDKLEALSYQSSCNPPPEPHITFFAALTTYLGYAVLIAFGHLRDFFGLTLSLGSRYISPTPREGVAPLLKSWENFYTRR